MALPEGQRIGISSDKTDYRKQAELESDNPRFAEPIAHVLTPCDRRVRLGEGEKRFREGLPRASHWGDRGHACVTHLSNGLSEIEGAP